MPKFLYKPPIFGGNQPFPHLCPRKNRPPKACRLARPVGSGRAVKGAGSSEQRRKLGKGITSHHAGDRMMDDMGEGIKAPYDPWDW